MTCTGKVCKVCSTEKPLSDYSKDNQRKDGLSRKCKDCRKIYNSTIYEKNKEKLKARSRAFAKNNPEKVAAWAKGWYAANKEHALRISKENYAANSEKRKASMKEWYAKNKASHDAASRAWARANPEKVAATTKAWTEANSARKAFTDKEWYAANPHIRAASSAKRRAAKMLRTPAWLNKEELLAIKQLYEKAKTLELETGVPHVVDHIMPLQGRKVSGLHVLSNLQIITAEQNAAKHNKWEPL